jgi:hypothetical protein
MINVFGSTYIAVTPNAEFHGAIFSISYASIAFEFSAVITTISPFFCHFAGEGL